MLARLMRRLHGPVYAARLVALVQAIRPHLRAGDAVLDVGCGFGTLGRALMDDPATAEGVTVRGLERVPRKGGRIEIDAYDGGTMPYGDGAFDVVIVADVLHHEPEPDRLLAECRRVARRLVIIKDHLRQGPFAQSRIALIDWAANAPYGVPCLYRYGTPEEWRATRERHALEVVEERLSLDLYPPGVNLLFGRRLQYLAVLARPEGSAGAPGAG